MIEDATDTKLPNLWGGGNQGSHLETDCWRAAEELETRVRDRTAELASTRLSEMVSSSAPGVGIRGMRERIHQLGGTLEISSDGNGKGTAVVVKLPVANVVPPVAEPDEDAAAAD